MDMIGDIRDSIAVRNTSGPKQEKKKALRCVKINKVVKDDLIKKKKVTKVDIYCKR